MALFLMGELVAALRTNDPDLFKRWLYGGIEDLGEPAVTELLLDLLDPFLTVEEQDRLLGWHLGLRIQTNERESTSTQSTRTFQKILQYLHCQAQQARELKASLN